MKSFTRLIFLFVVIFSVYGCSIRKRINAEVQKSGTYGLKGNEIEQYAFKSRRAALRLLKADFFEDLDTLVLVEYYLFVQGSYSCTLFGNSVARFDRDGIEPLRKIDLSLDTAYKSSFDVFVYEKIMSGHLQEVLDRSKNAPVVTNSNSISVFIVNIGDRKVNALGFNIRRFRTDEEQARRDSLLRQINIHKDHNKEGN